MQQVSNLAKFFTRHSGTHQANHHTIPEEEFDDKVDKMFAKVKIPLGVDEEGKKWYFEYDFASIAWHPVEVRWKIASVWFIAKRADGETKFSLWKQPELVLYKSNKFTPKMEKWIRKKYKLDKFNPAQVAAKIVKAAELIENKIGGVAKFRVKLK